MKELLLSYPSMARRQTGFDVVRALGLELPDVEESTMYGAPALKVRGKLLACMASHKSAEPNSLVVLIGFDERDALIADDPRTYYVKPHYQDYPSVLVRLALIDREALRDLLRSAWRTVTTSTTTRRRRATLTHTRRQLT
jgi:hypothetical protein